jgi:hypothetical protein
MEPFGLAVLAIAFLKSAFSSAGDEVGKAAGQRIAQALFPAVQGTSDEGTLVAMAQGTAQPAAEQRIQQHVVSRASNDPAYGTQLQDSLNQALREAPGLADALPAAAQKLFGLSNEQTAAQRGKCPIGGEMLIFPSYFDGQGNPLSIAPLGSFFSFPRSAWARCRRGHTWSVFAAGGRTN